MLPGLSYIAADATVLRKRGELCLLYTRVRFHIPVAPKFSPAVGDVRIATPTTGQRFSDLAHLRLLAHKPPRERRSRRTAS